MRKAFEMKGIPTISLDITLPSITDSTYKQYDSALKNWWYFCAKNKKDPFTDYIPDILEFLTEKFNNGASYGSVNCYRSAIALIVGPTIAQDDRSKRFFKGVAKLRPQKSKYDSTWNPKIVLDFFNSLPENGDLSIKELSLKVITLLALITGHRMQTFSLINIENIEKSDIKISILKLKFHIVLKHQV